MDCPKCHSLNARDASFCGSCGASLSGAAGDYSRETESLHGPTGMLTVGATLAGRYRITQHIGKGGMGVVYKAEDLKLKRPVALKFLPPELTRDEAAKQRFVHEAQAASALDHPNICTIHEVDETPDGQMFIAMAFCDGETLRERIKRGPVSVEDAIEIAFQICDGLTAAHRSGVIHRDIKPGNIMVRDAAHVRIVDFGLAKLAGEMRLTTAGTVLGTVDYMAPEQARGDDVDSRVDIWALGVVLYEMLAGLPPFKGENQQAIIYSILHSDPEPVDRLRPDVPADLARTIERCLARDPAERYQTAADLGAALEALRASPAGFGRSRLAETRRRLGWRRQGPRKSAATGVGIAAVAAVALGAAVAMMATLPPGRPLLTFEAARPWVRLWLGPQPLPVERYVAILPFEMAVAKGDSAHAHPRNQALCDGLVDVSTRRLIAAVPAADSVWVVPWDDVRSEAAVTPEEARDDLGVTLALTGSVECSGDAVALTADLVDTKTLRSLRHLAVSEPIANLSTWQNDLVVRLAGMLGVDIAPRRLALLAEGGAMVPAAYRSYLLGRGYLYPSEGARQIDSAMVALNRSIAEDSAFALAYVAMGDACVRKREETKDKAWLDKAAFWADEAVRVDDRLPSSYGLLGIVKAAMGHSDEAIAAVGKALELDPAYFEGYLVMGGAYQSEGESDLAIGAFKRALDLQPRSYGTYNRLWYAYRSQKSYRESIAPLRAMISLRPARTTGYVNLGATYFDLGDWQEAREAFEQALSTRPVRDSLDAARRASIYSNLGTIYSTESQYATADSMYREALRLSSEDYRIWANYADAWYWTPGKRDSARAMFRTATAIAERDLAGSPRDPDILANLASYYSMVDERGKAYDYLGRVLVLDPTDAAVLERIAETYEQLGDRERALAWLEKALRSGYPLWRIDRAPCWRNLSNDQGFREMLRRLRLRD